MNLFARIAIGPVVPGFLMLALTACGTTSVAPQQSPEVKTEPEIVVPTAAINNVARLNNDLSALKTTIQHLEQEAEKTANAPGPSFDGELDTLKTKAIQDCDNAESLATNLLVDEYVKNTSGVTENVNDDLAEIKALRDRIQKLR